MSPLTPLLRISDTAENSAAGSANDLYAAVVLEFGPALARLAAAYEADRAQQQDLLQDIHLALWRSLETFKNQCSLRTWVYRVAHNTAATYVLRHKRARWSQLVSLEELDEMPDEFDGERLLDESAVRERLNKLVQRLKTIDRNTILLYLEGMDAAGISDVLGISPSNVAQKVHRTKKLLMRCFWAGRVS
jgi:RNA polymerase sigma-70 factor (ECF subfamily)